MPRPYFLSGKPSTASKVGASFSVLDKFTGQEFASVMAADRAVIDAAIGAADRARPAMASLDPTERAKILERAAGLLEERRDTLVDELVAEGGKPLTYARAELERLLATFRISAQVALGLVEEPVDASWGSQTDGTQIFRRPVPVGVVGLITPFNFPLNLVAHKVAPAIAAGCPFVLKPASSTPLSALSIAAALSESGLPEGAYSVLPARGQEAEALASDARVAKFSFTGSDGVGWALHKKAGAKRVTLELGGNAAVIVDESVDSVAAAQRIAGAAFGHAGQSCISVQRVIVTEAAYEGLRHALIEATEATPAGDPRLEATVAGPMISESEAQRVGKWIDEAVAGGARVLAGGAREAAVFQPTLLENVPSGARALDEEIFGPVAVLVRVADFEAAIVETNRTRFGLQAGVLTADPARAQAAWERLVVGGVIVGDVPTWRADAMPYGGVKDSGLGREGPRYAVESMVEWRLAAFRSLL